MPKFKYKGRDKHGQLIEGNVEAFSRDSVAANLLQAEIIPVHISVSSNQIKIEDLVNRLLHRDIPHTSDLIIFSQQMHSLLKSGVPFMPAVKTACSTTHHKGLKNALIECIISLESGLPFSAALQRYPRIFSPVIIAMIEVGEKTGQLVLIFKQIKRYLEFDQQTSRRLQASFRYPLLVLTVLIAAIFIVNLLVIPSFTQFFESFDAILPLATRLLIASSNLFIQHGVIIMMGLIGMFAVFRLWSQSAEGELVSARLKLKIPFVGNIIERICFARFFRSFAICDAAEIPLLQTYSVLSKVMGNAYLSQKILAMRHSIEEGKSIYMAAHQSHLFSPLVLQMLKVSDETGEIEDILVDIAQYYENDIDYDLGKLTDYLEPTIIIIISFFILILALGIFLPMWDISTVAFRKVEGF